jgi:hypothetical protein
MDVYMNSVHSHTYIYANPHHKIYTYYINYITE